VDIDSKQNPIWLSALDLDWKAEKKIVDIALNWLSLFR